MGEKTFEIFTDGGASGNPGPAGIGIVIKQDAKTIFEISESIGDATNNVAEYKAVIAALKEAIRRKAEKVFLNTDSELVYYQLTGSYKVKNEILLLLVEEVRQLSRKIKSVEIKVIPREKNTQADRLAKQAIVKHKFQSTRNGILLKSAQSRKRDFAPRADAHGAQQAKVVASKPIFGEESPSSTG